MMLYKMICVRGSVRVANCIIKVLPLEANPYPVFTDEHILNRLIHHHGGNLVTYC